MNESIRILLVDDEQDYTLALSRRMTRRGLHVDTASDGYEAFDALHAGNYDVVVLDINMPGIDGMQTLKAIRKSVHGVPVILHTGAGTINEAQKALRAGAFDFLFKPVHFEDLMNRILDAAESMGKIVTPTTTSISIGTTNRPQPGA